MNSLCMKFSGKKRSKTFFIIYKINNTTSHQQHNKIKHESDNIKLTNKFTNNIHAMMQKHSSKNTSEENFLGKEGTTYLGKPLERALLFLKDKLTEASVFICILTRPPSLHTTLFCIRVSRSTYYGKISHTIRGGFIIFIISF